MESGRYEIIIPHRRLRQTAGALLCLLFLSLFTVSDAEAACPSTFGAQGTPVQLVSCTDGTTANGGNVTVAVPASQIRDLLVAFVSKDGGGVVNIPAGWNSIVSQAMGGNSGSLRVFTRTVDGTEPANYTFSWGGGNEAAYASIMRFTGASGQVVVNSASATTGNAVAPAITTTVNNTSILRIGGRDTDNNTNNPATIVPGHTAITQEVVGNGGNAAMGAAAFVNQPVAGSSGTGTFTNMGSSSWAAATIGIEPIEFRFSMPDAVASVCGTQQVTLSVTNRNGTPLPWFQGTVTLSTSAGGAGDWYDAGSLNGTLNNGTVNDGIATYQFTAADAGVATFEFQRSTTGTLNFNLNWGVFTESASFDPSFTIDNNCRFRISHDGNAGTCSVEPVTITIVDSGGTPATFYTGSITLSAVDDAPPNTGDYTLNSGSGSFSNGTADDGTATYTFVQGESAVVLDFAHTTADSGINFDVVDAGNPAYTVDGAYDPDLVVGACALRFSHSGTSDACSIAQVTLSVVDPGGLPISGFVGTVNLSVDNNDGVWTNVDGSGAFTAGGGGSATYTFVTGDGGDVILGYSLYTSDTVNFNATADGGIASPIAPYDDNLVISLCTAELTVNPTMDVCSVSETVTITIRNSLGNVATDFAGVVVISTSTSKGNYSIAPPANARLDNGAPGDGVATFEFETGDNGVVALEFDTGTVQSLVFNVSSTYTTFNSAASNENLQVLACHFRISHDESMDVCTPDLVTFSLFNSAGAAVTDYEGTINLSTSSGNGTWSNSTGNGTVTDPVAEDGSATYEFVLADNGSVQLSFANLSVETLNFNATDGQTNDSNASFDPVMEVLVCEFRISLVDAVSTACDAEQVTISVYNSVGVLATNFTGTMTLNTSTVHGTWQNAGALNGTLSETTPDDGFATYTFVGADNGTAVFNFFGDVAEILNFNLASGEIEESSSFDPDFLVTGCVPEILNYACYPGASGGTGSLDVLASNDGRLVVMAIFHVDPSPQDVLSATFGGAAMTQIYEQTSSNTGVEMWGILNADIPSGGGVLAGEYFWDAAPANTPSMCLVEIANVDQDFPVINGGTPDLGEVNGNSFTSIGNPLELETTIRTTANNALILSAGVKDGSGGGASDFNAVAPVPPMFQLFFDSNDQNPVGGTGAGSFGLLPSKGSFTVTDIDQQDADTSASHIVASFNPKVTGVPAVQGFIPVELFETLSGNISYHIIGASLRTGNSSGGTACDMSPIGTGASATLALPAGSNVQKAYLYWAGSGEAFEADNTVTFGPTGSEISITADQTFQIEGVGDTGDLSYFAGYKDVTSQITNANGSYTLYNLLVQTDKPWSQVRACAGGWALAVVYENAKERFRVANVFHGFQWTQDNSFSLTPRNFRMATTDNDPMGYLPNGKIGNITLEGDENVSGSEAIGIQAAPNSDVFNDLNNSFNPAGDVFNGTVTRPLLYEPGDSIYYEWDSTNGTNSDGYEIDEPGTGGNIGETWGLDIDTYYLTGNDNTGELWNFAQSGSEAEQFSARYASGNDLVMLLAEIVVVTNFDLADLEVFKTQTQNFTVSGTGQYQFQVTNNGNGGATGGDADGRVLLADVLPTGLTLASVSGTDWSCTTSANAFTCEYDITTDCGIADGCTTPGLLGKDASLPLLTANINVAGPATFPLISTNVKNVARLQHNGGNCGALTAGVIPDPLTCDREPQFDNVNDLDSGAIDINDLDDKTAQNNNVHSVVTEVRGIRTDLGISKSLNGILEVNNQTSYTLTVTNFGPNATSGGAEGTITVNDVEPAAVTFGAVSGSGWTCNNGPGDIECTYTGVLGAGASAPPITIVVNVPSDATSGNNVTNTAQVTAGLYNFDTNSSNNSATNISTIVAEPVSAGERFMMSVWVPENTTQIGDLATFENDDIIFFNPLTDTGTLFYDNSANGNAVDDVNAVHFYVNGHVALSASGSSTIGGLAFEPEDIVVWDPILDTAILLFDGSAVFDGTIDANQNIDSVYVRSDGRIVFSIAGTASITYTGPTTVTFESGDIVEYDPSDGSVSVLVNGEDANIFNATAQVDALYVLVDPNNAEANLQIYDLSVDESTIQIGVCDGCDPSPGTSVTRDDIGELDLSGPQLVTSKQFVGNSPIGVFSNPSSSSRTIDALHVIEDRYFGHFAISQSQIGNTCQAGQITIRKHKGLTHTVDTNYTGSILITTDLGEGKWTIANGNGTLINGAEETPEEFDGAARYTFVPSDNGEVTLYLQQDTVSTLNVNVTNGLVQELGSEDPNFTYNFQITEVSYRDEWGAAELDNNDGSTFWADSWTEVDGAGAGLNIGNISADNGELEMTATSGDPNPEISRAADLATLYTVTENVFLNLDYHYEFLNSGSDVLDVQVSLTGGAPWTTVHSFSGIGGTNATPQALSLNLDTILGSPTWTANTTIRFRISGGYTGTSRMFLDNIELVTGTNDCGIGSIQHYEVTVNGVTGNGTLVPGLQCLSAVVTVTGHDANHFPSASGEMITLTTSTGRGDWLLAAGQPGSVTNGTEDDGVATYTFAPGQQAATFIFNYTNPSADEEQVTFGANTAYFIEPTERPTLVVYQAGLLFYNETATGPTSSSPIPTQIAGKFSNIAPDITILNIEGVRTSDNDPLACSPLFDAGNTLTIEFAAECLDPGTCSGSNSVTIDSLAPSNNSKTLIAGSDNGGAGTAASYQTLDVPMTNQPGSRVGGEVAFRFVDVGEMELHARYQVPLNEDISGFSGYGEGYMSGSSAPFVVRPFGFDIDFSNDRFLNGIAGASYAADAVGSFLQTAGVGFDTTVTAVIWEQADDMDNDGVPDEGAALGNNAVTPNFGNESAAGNYEVIIERLRSVLPLNSSYGSLTDNRFSSFTGTGFDTHSITYDEVGIIDLTARLVNTGTTDNGNYLGTGFNLFGNVKNVGRFFPGYFEISNGVIDSRPLTSGEPRIDSMPGFTYMGEEFGISATVSVYNGATPAAEVHNYVGSLAKLGNKVLDVGNTDLAAAKFVAVDSTGSPVDLSARLGEANSASRNLSINWEASPSATSSAKTLSGNLIFNRANPEVPDGPLTIDIGLATTDPDSIGFTLDLDVDDGQVGEEAALIQNEEFRYGRLLIDNAYGSELEPLGIGFTVEYFDSSIGASGEFVLNTDDSTTTLMYDASENLSANRSMFFVSGTFTDNLVEDTNEVLEAGETFIEASAISGNIDVKTSISRGRTVLSHSSQQDTPFYASAPGENRDGSAIVEFNLTDSSLPFSLDFLSYGWRGAGEAEDINNEANDYSDNPRGQIGFGSYRGHDRVLNWQEIYTSP